MRHITIYMERHHMNNEIRAIKKSGIKKIEGVEVLTSPSFSVQANLFQPTPHLPPNVSHPLI